jgi:hypothetical protein
MFIEISVIIFWLLIIGIIVLIVLIITGKINVNEEFNIETNVPITWVSTTFTNQSVNGTYSYQLIGDQVTLRLNSISSENKGTANGLISSSLPLPSHLIPNINIYGPVIPVLSNGNVATGSYIIYSNGTISFGLGWTNNSPTSTDFSLVPYGVGTGGSNNAILNITITYLLK